jgi:hypothetical protein
MNTNKLKKFAQEARKKLIEQVSAKLEFVLNTNTVELLEKKEQVAALKDELTRTSKKELIDKVAYTWFNRLIALRFMDVNDYQPLDIRVVSPKDGYTFPELLDEAKQGHIPRELKINGQQVLDLLDGKVPNSNPQNEAYKLLLIAACNHLHTVLPFLFERINHYTELLLPDDLTSEFSIVHDVREGMPVDDCKEVEIIGWLYQFYISEKKDEVFASNAKVKKEDIPAATQLFTPRWIVEYMVQNTVGKLWLQNRPGSKLREHMPYFIESASLKSEDYLKVNSPEELTLLDQACGSGHILVYGFELLAKIYEEEGYNSSDIPKLIIEKNLYGFEIDGRASQLASMALMMKARSYQRRFFKKGEVPQPKILCFQDLKIDEKQILSVFEIIKVKPSDKLLHDLKNMQQATNLGSLIIPNAGQLEIQNVLRKIEDLQGHVNVFEQYKLLQLKDGLVQLHLLSQKYTCIVDNPPYMGGGNMNAPLADFVKRNYPESKADLMACFMESGLAMLQPRGFLGMINQHSWMFLGSYIDLRKKLLNSTLFDTLLHLGSRTFPEIGGEVVQNASFTICNTILDDFSVCLRLVNFDKSELKRVKVLDAINKRDTSFTFIRNQKVFKKLPDSKFNFWFSPLISKIFEKEKPLAYYAEKRLGMCTGNNERFIRYWQESDFKSIGFDFVNLSAFKESGLKSVPHNKGGEFRKWYGNNHFVLHFDEENYNLLSNSCNKLASKSHYFLPNITWSELASHTFGVRYQPSGFVFNIKGPCLFPHEISFEYLLGALNTNSFNYLVKGISNSLSINGGDVEKIPLILNPEKQLLVEKIAGESVSISKEEWDSKETSWDFVQNECIRICGQDLEETYDLYKQYWSNKFYQLHKNEEELNRQFIEIYNLQDELTPDVPLKDITILQEETSIENGELAFHADEVMAQFVSYAVGCIFGRYSLDKPGLIMANQGETLQNYLQKHERQEHEISFLPDADNIIPILDDEWFEDDIVGRFYEFLKVTFGEANFTKNLAFVEDCLGKDIRKYFVKDFYNDHVKRYKKRPIYWMFSSPQGSFNVIIYMHRYTPDTISNILNKYLREYQEKLRTRREHMDRIEISGSPSEKTKAIKEKERIDKVLLELQEYEREILYPLATERIAIDLDNGVLVNYNLFGNAVKAVPGLNDAKTKKKVKEFDWVKVEQTV